MIKKKVKHNPRIEPQIGLFQKYTNLKWLLPLLFVLFISFFFITQNPHFETKSNTKQVTHGGLTSYENKQWRFALKYNPSWEIAPCDNGSSFFLFLAPTDESLGHCQSEFGGQMSVFIQPGNSVNQLSLPSSDFTSIQTQTVTVSGVVGKRNSGIGIKEADGVHPSTKGDIYVSYDFYTNGNTYILVYTQKSTGSLSKNVLADFDSMVQKTLTFTDH